LYVEFNGTSLYLKLQKNQNMILLDNTALITPDLGLVFWTTLIFLTLWFILGKFAFKPISNALKQRSSGIDDALKQAEKARKEMSQLQSDNERVLNEAKEERVKILKDAKEMREQIIAKAKEDAKEEARKETEKAMQEIQNQKMAAIMEVKNMIGSSTVDLARKVLKRELATPADHENFIAQEIEKLTLN